MKTRTIGIRVTDSLYNKLSVAAKDSSISSYVVKAIEERLKGGAFVKQQRAAMEASANTSKMVNENIATWMSQNPNWFEALPDDQKAKIISGWASKFIGKGFDSDQETLSLKESIEKLPKMDDITFQLARCRDQLAMAKEQIELLKSSRDPSLDQEKFACKCYEAIVELVWAHISRNSLPGIGDGGGLSEHARTMVASEVKQWLKYHQQL